MTTVQFRSDTGETIGVLIAALAIFVIPVAAGVILMPTVETATFEFIPPKSTAWIALAISLVGFVVGLILIAFRVNLKFNLSGDDSDRGRDSGSRLSMLSIEPGADGAVTTREIPRRRKQLLAGLFVGGALAGTTIAITDRAMEIVTSPVVVLIAAAVVLGGVVFFFMRTRVAANKSASSSSTASTEVTIRSIPAASTQLTGGLLVGITSYAIVARIPFLGEFIVENPLVFVAVFALTLGTIGFIAGGRD